MHTAWKQAIRAMACGGAVLAVAVAVTRLWHQEALPGDLAVAAFTAGTAMAGVGWFVMGRMMRL